MIPVNQRLLQRFLRLAGKKLTGDWVLIGGSVLPVLGITHRVTLDIDLAGPPKSGQQQMLVLMEIAESLGLPVEAINQAGAFFLRKIKGWQRSIVLLHQGESATFYRPDVSLYLQLKLERLSESDLEDCLALVAYAQAIGEPIRTKKLRTLIDRALASADNAEKLRRLQRLREVVVTSATSS